MPSSDQEISHTDSELDILSSSHAASTKTTAKVKRVRHRYSVWIFQLTVSADATALNRGCASDSVTLQERHKFLATFCLSTSNLAFFTPCLILLPL
jgi:hypothetical protein